MILDEASQIPTQFSAHTLDRDRLCLSSSNLRTLELRAHETCQMRCAASVPTDVRLSEPALRVDMLAAQASAEESPWRF